MMKYMLFIWEVSVLDLFFSLLTRAAFFPAEFSSSAFLFLFLSREFGTFFLFFKSKEMRNIELREIEREMGGGVVLRTRKEIQFNTLCVILFLGGGGDR